ncbi:MAG: M24 family metallopeptidase [Bacillota bacterium]
MNNSVGIEGGIASHAGRLERLYMLMERDGIDCMFLKVDGDLEYLTGIRRQRLSATEVDQPADFWYGAFIEKEKGVTVISPYMVGEYVKTQVEGKPFIRELLVLPEHEDPFTYVSKALTSGRNAVRRLGVSKRLWAITLLGLQSIFPGCEIVDAGPLVNSLRRIKDAEEVRLMERAGQIVDQVFYEVVRSLRVGVTELEVARDIDYLMQTKGAEGTSFVTGVTFEGTGKRERTEIGRAYAVHLEPGMHVAFDFGCVYQGYCSDFGRTVYCGEPDAERAGIHRLVMEAQEEGIKAMVSGKIKACEVDRIVRSRISEAGYGKYFWHRLGHGIGCDVHEAPFLTSSDETVLETGMCFTVEPGVFIPGFSSIRVEDVVMVTPQGGLPFSKATKDIIVV